MRRSGDGVSEPTMDLGQKEEEESGTPPLIFSFYKPIHPGVFRYPHLLVHKTSVFLDPNWEKKWIMNILEPVQCIRRTQINKLLMIMKGLGHDS